MPCFKGLAVSIHTPNGPLPEHAVQRSSRFSRISSYIPVPPAQIPIDDSGKRPEQSTFAISITLLTPGLDVPYSAPRPTADEPCPEPKLVGQLPGFTSERGRYTSGIGPYIPLTTSPNETIAAYIYFDGRPKEEVATLLRRGEETWVNSRWVGVSQSEGGGLAEREFLFREVGLERWLNGLDLDGKDAAATIERRRQKLERRRRKRKETKVNSDDEGGGNGGAGSRRGILKYGQNEISPLEKISDEEGSSSGSDDSDNDPIPETAGQIKVALFRVLASGEIKKGEYSPQFDAHDDDDEAQRNGHTGNTEASNEADVDHTTSFAKPKSLDPKTISTQTVTGIDPTDKPYAVFTFLYRGERQLQKMGILHPPKADKTAPPAKRKSLTVDLTTLGPLKQEGTVGFSTFRDNVDRPKQRRKGSRKESFDEMGSDSEDDEDDDVIGKMDDGDGKPQAKENDSLSPEDAERTGALAEGVRKIKLKRQHSSEPLNNGTGPEGRKSSKSATPSATSTPNPNNGGTDPSSVTPPMSGAPLASTIFKANIDGSTEDASIVGSPMKRQRPSVADSDTNTTTSTDPIQRQLGIASLASNISEFLGSSSSTTTEKNTTSSSATALAAALPPLSSSTPHLSSGTYDQSNKTILPTTTTAASTTATAGGDGNKDQFGEAIVRKKTDGDGDEEL